MASPTLDAVATDVAEELLLPAQSSWLRTARQHVERLVGGAGLDGERGARFVYAVNEALTNAIRHGAPDDEGRIRLCTVIEDERITVRVHDSGTFVMPASPARPDAESGRGFALMASFADEVRLNIRPGATTVSLVARLAR